MRRPLAILAALILAAAAQAADELKKPDIPDPFGLGERLALLDYLKTELHATVAEGASYEDMVKQYWDIVDKPKREAEAAQRAETEQLRARLRSEFKIESDESDPAKLKQLIAQAEEKAVLRIDGSKDRVGERSPDPPDKGEAKKPAADETLTLDVPGGTAVEVRVPTGWKAVRRRIGDAAEPIVLRLDAPNLDASLVLSLTPIPEGTLDTADKLELAVKGIAERVVTGASDQKFTPKRLDGAKGLACYAEFTDVKLQGQSSVTGQIPAVAVGMVMLGSTGFGFTAMGRSFDQAEFVAAKGVVIGAAPHAGK